MIMKNCIACSAGEYAIDVDKAHAVMEEYARQEAIAFAQWVLEKALAAAFAEWTNMKFYTFYGPYKKWIIGREGEKDIYKTTAELYDLFLQSQNTQQGRNRK